MKRDPIPAVMQRLFAEHRYISALVRVIEQKSEPAVRHKAADFYLLRDVIGYVHDYPDHVHHPTEDLVFECVLRRKPGLRRIVARLRAEHVKVIRETEALLARIDEVIERPDATRMRSVLRDCRKLARRQRAHIHLENHEAFPAAIATLTAADWTRIEARYLSAEDPLFGPNVSNTHRPLYEFLLDYADGADGAQGIAELLSLERLARSSRVLVRGAGEGWQRLASLGDEISRQPWSADWLLRVGSSMGGCGGDLVKIWARTAQDTFTACTVRNPPARQA